MVSVHVGMNYAGDLWWASVYISALVTCHYRYGSAITPGSSLTLHDGNRIRRDIRV